MSDRQTAAVRAAATKRTADAEAHVRKALRAIAASGEGVNFVAVAAAARVSRQFLYSHPELRAEIEQLRAQTLAVARLPARGRAGDDSARHRLRAALDDNTAPSRREPTAQRRARHRPRRVTGTAAAPGAGHGHAALTPSTGSFRTSASDSRYQLVASGALGPIQ